MSAVADDLLSDGQTVHTSMVRTHLTQLVGQLQVFVHHSSEELKAYNTLPSVSCFSIQTQ